MEPKDGDIYPKYSFRLSHAEKRWLDLELAALKAKFNAGSDGAPIVTKNVLLMTALKRGLRFLREDVHARCIQKTREVGAPAPDVWRALTEASLRARWWGVDAPSAVTASVPNELLQFAWREPAWPDADETVCTIQLRPAPSGGTRLEVVHSGWEIFAGTPRAHRQSACDAAWDGRLDRLAALLASR